MYSPLWFVCLLFAASLIVWPAHASASTWYNQAQFDPVRVQTRINFPVGLIETAALVIERYPPLCRRSDLLLEFGPAVFSDSLVDQLLHARLQVDVQAARTASFASYRQHRDDGIYLVLILQSIARSSTFLSELENGSTLQIQLMPSYPIDIPLFPLKGSQQSLQEAIDLCAKQNLPHGF